MQKGSYRKLKKGRCTGCDHPTWSPSKNVNPRRMCIKCRKNDTRREKTGQEKE